MRPVTSTLAAAILAADRTVRSRVNVDWDGDGHGPVGSIDDLGASQGAVSVSSNLQTTLPDQVSVVEGTAAATFTMDLLTGNASDERAEAVRYFSPFNTDSALYGKERLNRDVTVTVEFLTAAGWESVPLVTGVSRGLPVSLSERKAQLSGIDYRSKLRQPIALPAMAASVPASGNLAACMPGLEGTWIVSYVLWLCGFPLSPPPPSGCRLWMPMHGSAMPFVGLPYSGSPVAYTQQVPANGSPNVYPIEFDTGPYVLATRAAKIQSGYLDEYVTINPDPAPGTALFNPLSGRSAGRLSMWVKSSGSPAQVTIQNGQLDTVFWSATGTTNQLQLTNTSGGGTRNITSPRSVPLDGAWHFVGVHWDDAAGSATFNIDGQLYMVPFTSTAFLVGHDDVLLVTVTASTPFAELQLSTGLTDPTAGWPSMTWTSQATVDRSALKLDGIVPGSPSEAWVILQELATAEQGAVWLDPYPVYATRRRLVTDAAQTSQRSITAEAHVFDMAWDFTLDKIGNVLTADYQPVAVSLQAKAWSPSGTVVVPAGSVVTVNASYSGLATDNRQVSGSGNTATNGTGTTYTLQQRDPTQQFQPLVYSVTYTSDTTATITLYNRTNKTIYMVDASGNSSLQITGDLIAQGQSSGAVVVSDAASIATYDYQPITMPSNRWTQSASVAAGLAMATLSDLKRPAPVFSSLVIPGDPRIQYFDRVTLTDPRNTGLTMDLWVIGKQHDLQPAQYDMTLTARPARNRFLAGTGLVGIDLVG
jgi:hypothetical protein